MSDLPKTPVNYQLKDLTETKKAIEESARLIADHHRLKCKVEDPKRAPSLVDKECKDKAEEARKELTKMIEERIKGLNAVSKKVFEFNAAEAKKAEEESREPKVAVGKFNLAGRSFEVSTQEEADTALTAFVEYAVSDFRDEKDKYQSILEAPAKRKALENEYAELNKDMQKRFAERTERLAKGLDRSDKYYTYYYSDLDVARLHRLNSEIEKKGEELGIPESKRLVHRLEYERQIFAGVVSRPELRVDAKHRIETDKLALEKAEESLKVAKLVLAAEEKKAEEAKALSGKGTLVPPMVMPGKDEKRPETLPEVLPPPKEQKKDVPPPSIPPSQPMSFMEVARQDVAAILSGNSDFTSDFKGINGKLAVMAKRQMVKS